MTARPSDAVRPGRRSGPPWLLIALAGLLILGVWVAWGRASDDFTALEALFTGLALTGVVASILLQSRELSLQREELALTRSEVEGQRRALEAQVEESRAQAEALRAQTEELRQQGERHQRQADVGLLAAYLTATQVRLNYSAAELDHVQKVLSAEAMGAVHRTRRRLNQESDGERRSE